MTASVSNVIVEPLAQEFEEIFREHYQVGYRTAYDYEFLASIPIGGRGAGAPPSRDPAARLAERAAAISDAISPVMEDQLGLRLEEGKFSFETLVIDEIDQPSPN